MGRGTEKKYLLFMNTTFSQPLEVCLVDADGEVLDTWTAPGQFVPDPRCRKLTPPSLSYPANDNSNITSQTSKSEPTSPDPNVKSARMDLDPKLRTYRHCHCCVRLTL